MKYEIRNLCSKDIFPMTKIISKIGFKELKSVFDADDIKNMAKKQDVEGAGFAFAVEMSGIIISNLSNCETEIYKFLSDITGTTIEELKNDSMADFAELIIAVFKKEDFKDFFGVVSKSFK